MHSVIEIENVQNATAEDFLESYYFHDGPCLSQFPYHSIQTVPIQVQEDPERPNSTHLQSHNWIYQVRLVCIMLYWYSWRVKVPHEKLHNQGRRRYPSQYFFLFRSCPPL